MTNQCAFHAEGFNQLTTGIDGYYLYNRNDLFVGRSLAKYGEFSGLEGHLLNQLCADGNIIIEVGANIGAHTVGLARKVGNSGRVLAFEPQRLVHQILCANVALNSLENVECYWAAVGGENGVITVPEVSPHENCNFGGVGLEGANSGLKVPCLMLDNFSAIPRLDLLKVDVEGMEADVIRGGRQLLQKFKPTLYLENDRIDKSKDLIELVSSLGYRLFWHMPPFFNPANNKGDAENVFATIVSVNMLCLHRDLVSNVSGMTEIVDSSFHPMKR